MGMRYFTEEIMVMTDGSTPVAITKKNSELEARSTFHQIMASALINENVASVHAEAKNSVGGVYESATYIRPIEPDPEDMIPEE